MFSQYPINNFPSQCGGEDTIDEPCVENFSAVGVDSYQDRHDPGCWCPTCQAPYSFPYVASQKACGNPKCTCGDCKGDCKCYKETNQLQQPQYYEQQQQPPQTNYMKYLLIILLICIVMIYLMRR